MKRLVALVSAVLLVGVALSFGACSTVNSHYNGSKAHHRPDGFANLDGTRQEEPFSRLATWQWQAMRAGLPKPPYQVIQGYNFPAAPRQEAFLKANTAQNTATWIGHATVLMQIDGLNILTDPVFSERTSPVQFAGPKRRAPLTFKVSDLPRIDVVVISHNHYDHLDTDSVRDLVKQAGGPPLFLVPLGVEKWFHGQGIQSVKAMDWWDQHAVKGVTFHFVPAHHWSSRSPFDRNASLWGGWVAKSSSFSFYFSGDTGMGEDFAQIAKRFGRFDFSAIPVGAYEPRWFMQSQHVNPHEAVQIHKTVGSALSLGVHWGTFELTDESLDQPMVDLPLARKALGVADTDFVLFQHGETRVLTPKN
jgi:N-acyl-phosphatidylethanolamine-hydrolysing phospholipase D